MLNQFTAILYKILTDPKVMIASVVGGFLTGIFFKTFGNKVASYGIIYITLLSMSILPIMTTAIISGLGDMLKSPETRGSLNKMIVIYGLGLLIPGLLGISGALIGKPGVWLDLRDMSILGETILSANQNGHPPQSLISFLGKVVPHNVFAAFSEGRIISMVFVSILIGLALGLLHTPKAKDTLSHIRVSYEAFELIFTWLICLLPVGLFCLLAGLISSIDYNLLQALLKNIHCRSELPDHFPGRCDPIPGRCFWAPRSPRGISIYRSSLLPVVYPGLMGRNALLF